MAVRNLNNQAMGFQSKKISLRVDRKTEQIIIALKKLNINYSQFIREAILEYYEKKLLKHLIDIL